MKPTQIDRRAWLRRTTGVFAAAGSAVASTFTRPIGAELYTVRQILPTQAEQTMKSLAEIGYREAECARADLSRLAPLLKNCGIKAVSCHVETPLITGNWAPWRQRMAAAKTPETLTLSAAIGELKRFGVQYAVMAYVLPDERGDLDFYRALADKMNQAAETCAAAGLQFAYHNHCFEFKGEAGQRPIDVLVERLDKKAGFELDVFWLSVAGQDPVAMISRLKGRVPLMHLKDKSKDTPVTFQESAVKPEGFKEVGSGVLNFAAILDAAARAGTAHFFVEQDQTPGDPVESLRASYQYLRKLKW